jgi:hypothetical protein
MDTLHIPEAIRESAPRHATRLDLVSATRRSQSLALASAHDDCQEAFAAADDLLRALRRFQALPTNRKDEMNGWLHDVAGGAIDQLGNVQGAIERELDGLGCNPLEPLDLSELTAFWESVK